VPVVARIAVLLVLLALLLAGCGDTEVVREPSLTVQSQDGDGRPDGAEPPLPRGGVRIVVITHGQASSPFWAIVRNGVDAAAKQMGALVRYRAPEVYSLGKMKALVERAVADKPDGLVVSFPEPGLAPVIKRAVAAGIPTITINSGGDAFRPLGVLAHVGQPEGRAGLLVGRRLARVGVRRALCVNHQVGNVGLDARCAGLARAMRAAGGSSRVLSIDDQSAETPPRIAAAVTRDRIDGVLTLGGTAALLALDGVQRAGRADGTTVATFDLGPDVLNAVREGRLAFAVDQQAYLQGYLPVVMLVQNAQYGLLPDEGHLVATGPRFVTRENAGKVLELSRRSIR